MNGQLNAKAVRQSSAEALLNAINELTVNDENSSMIQKVADDGRIIATSFEEVNPALQSGWQTFAVFVENIASDFTKELAGVRAKIEAFAQDTMVGEQAASQAVENANNQAADILQSLGLQ